MFINFFSTTIGGESGDLPPDIPTQRDVIIITLLGQSNALGRADASLLPPSDADLQDDIYIYNLLNETTPYIAGNFNNNIGQYGVELFLGQKLRDHYSRPIVFAKYAVGGTILANDIGWSKGSWNLNASNSLWTKGVNHNTNCERYAKLSNLTGASNVLVWVQGESDSDVEAYADAYYTNEKAVFENWKSYKDDQNALIVSALTYTAPIHSSTVRAAKELNASELNNVKLIDINGYQRQDSVHLNQQGFRDFAEDLFQLLKNNITV